MANQAVSQGAQLLRLPAVIARTGWSRSSIYRSEAAGTFPKRVKLGERASAWVASEIDSFVAQRVANRDQDEAIAKAGV